MCVCVCVCVWTNTQMRCISQNTCLTVFLFEHRQADVSQRGIFRRTPLSYAATSGWLGTDINYALARSLSPNLNDTSQANQMAINKHAFIRLRIYAYEPRLTTLTAHLQGHVDAVRTLFEFGATITDAKEARSMMKKVQSMISQLDRAIAVAQKRTTSATARATDKQTTSEAPAATPTTIIMPATTPTPSTTPTPGGQHHRCCEGRPEQLAFCLEDSTTTHYVGHFYFHAMNFAFYDCKESSFSASKSHKIEMMKT